MIRSRRYHPAVLSLAVLVACSEPIAPPKPATVQFCSPGEMPTWFAYQNAHGGWVPVQPQADLSFAFAPTERLAIAYDVITTTAVNTTSTLNIVYLSAAELAELRCAYPLGGGTLAGSVVNWKGGDSYADVAFRSQTVTVEPQNPGFVFTGAGSAPVDLVAGVSSSPRKLIVRHDVDARSVSPMDFNGAEAQPVSGVSFTLNPRETPLSVDYFFLTSAGTKFHFLNPTKGTDGVPADAVPMTLSREGDVHVFTYTLGLPPQTTRSMITYFRGATDRTVSVGPAIGTPSITTASSTPYLLELKLGSQPQYGGFVAMHLRQDVDPTAIRLVNVIVSAGYVGTIPITWDVVIPNLNSVHGFNPAWALEPGLDV